MKCRLFASLVHPIQSYACEVWSVVGGGNTAMEQLEKFHVGFLRHLLGVPINTTGRTIYAKLVACHSSILGGHILQVHPTHA